MKSTTRSSVLNGLLPTLLAMVFGWFLYMLCRKTFSSTMPHLTYNAGFTKDQLGTIASSFSMAYGVSKFLGAMVSDHADPGLLFSLGLFLTGLTTLAFPLSSTVPYCSTVLFLQGVVNGVGWPAVAKILKVRFPPQRVGLWWSVISCAGSMAAALSPVLVAWTAKIMEWNGIYYAVGGLTVVLSVIVYFAIPASSSPSTNQPSQDKPTSPEVSYSDLLRNVDLWLTSWVYFILYLLKNAIVDWGQLYFIQQLNYKQTNAAFCISMTLFGGSLGNIAFGYLSDYLTKKLPGTSRLPRTPALLLSTILLTIFIHFFVFFTYAGVPEFSLSLLCFLLGFAVDGGVAVVGLVAMDTAPDYMSGASHGIACAWAQVGTLISGWPFSVLVVNYGWTNSLFALEVAGFFMIAFSAFLSYKSLLKAKKNN